MPYLGKQSEQVGVSIQKYEFLQATDTSSGTTSFSVPSDAGDHVNVWLNGVLLVEGASNDYTTTSTTVVFGSAPADGDIIRIDVVESFSLPDALKSSGDTMTGPLKLDGGLKQQTSQDLSGTYAYHQMMVSDAFTVAGDVTISDNLVLTKISDDSNAITLTDDGSTRTITGTGSLETSTIAQTPNSSLTGMTGTLGAGVFPAGHVIQTVSKINTTGQTVNSGATYVNVGMDLSITPSSASNDILVFVDMEISPMYKNGVDGRGGAKLLRDSTLILEQSVLGFYIAGVGTDTNLYMRVGMHRMDSPATTNTITYKVEVKNGNASHFSLNNSTGGSSITLMEIQR